MWLDLLLILLAIAPMMYTAKFHLRSYESREDEAGITAWEPCLQAAPEAHPHRVRES
jgi:hypothetical protein